MILKSTKMFKMWILQKIINQSHQSLLNKVEPALLLHQIITTNYKLTPIFHQNPVQPLHIFQKIKTMLYQQKATTQLTTRDYRSNIPQKFLILFQDKTYLLHHLINQKVLVNTNQNDLQELLPINLFKLHLKWP